MSADSSIAVKKLEVECRVSAAVANKNAIAARLSKIAKKQLSATLADCLQPLEQGGDQVVLIKNLQLDLDIDVLLDETEIARLWAGKITKVLLQELSSAKASNIAVFENRAAYLAAALLDMARGRARNVWYYRPFDGLWALPVSAALRTALLDDTKRGLEALTRLRPHELVEVCSALTTTDAWRLMDTLFPPAPRVRQEDAAVFAAAVNDDFHLTQGLDDKPAQQALLLAALVLCAPNSLDVAQVGACARCLAQLLRYQARYPDRFDRILASLAAEDPGTLKLWLEPADLADSTYLLNLGGRALQHLARPLRAQPNGRAAQDDRLGFTRFGNALLLLPHINRLPLQSVSRWPEHANHTAESLLRWLVLCVCQGANRFYAATQDSLLRDLCGIGPQVNLTELSAWLNERLTRPELAIVFKALQKDAHAGTVSRFQWLDKRITALVEPQKGRWLDLTIEESDGALAGIDQASDQASNHDRTDFEALWLSDRLQFSANTRVCLSVLAQNTLKSFAYRISGFARSSVNYLLQNLLSMSATLSGGEGRITAQLSRVPLSVMLNMTGITRGGVELPHFDARPIQLIESP